MKEGWVIKDFIEVCKLVGGSQPSKDNFIYEPRDGYIRLIQVRDYRTDKYITYIPKEKAKRFCKKDDIMIGRYGPPIFGIFKGLEGAYNVALMKAVVNEKICDKDYFFLFLQTDKLREFVEYSSKRAAGQDGVRKELLDKYPVPLPPIPEQQRIVSILDQCFAAIDKAKANAEQNLKNAKELFESYLQGVFEKKGDGWEDTQLAKLCLPDRIITYGVIKLGDSIENGTPCLRTSNVRWLKIDLTGMKKILPELSDEYSRTILRGNEVLVNVRGTLGGVAVVPKTMKGWNVSREVAVIPIDNEKADSSFIAYLIGSVAAQKWLGGVKKGAAYVGINIEDLRLLPISLPEIKEQKFIVQKLDSFSDETKKLEIIYQQKLADLDELKKSVLQKAFSGELTGREVEV